MSDSSHAGATVKPELAARAAALAALVVCWVLGGEAFHAAYIAAFLFWAMIPLGSCGLLMLHHLTGGRWGWWLRPALEPLAGATPCIAVAFIPVAAGMPSMRGWTASDVWAWSGPVGMGIRSVAVLAIWGVGGAWLAARSREAAPEGRDPPRLRAVSAAGMIVLFLTVTFAAVDWIGDLDPRWTSSVFGFYVAAGAALTAMSAAILAVTLSPAPIAPPIVRRDVGNLLFTLVLLHAYMSFSQFFIVWNGNSPRLVEWFAARSVGGWNATIGSLALFKFALPLWVLLFRGLKERPGVLEALSVLLLLGQFVEDAWVVLPSTGEDGAGGVVLAGLLAVCLGGLWMPMYLGRAAGRRAAGWKAP